MSISTGAVNASVSKSAKDIRTIFVEGYGLVTFDLADLAAAEARIRSAAPEDRGSVLAGLPSELAAVAIFDMSYLSEEVHERTVRLIAGPCYETTDCDKGVPSPTENEPPADPPATHVPAPPPTPTCYGVEDTRTAKFGILWKITAFKFHQRVEYCVLGQIIQPGYGVAAWYSNTDILWDCQHDQVIPISEVNTLGPNQIHALSVGKCKYALQLNDDVESSAGNARPSINDTYGVDGQRIIRSGNSY